MDREDTVVGTLLLSRGLSPCHDFIIQGDTLCDKRNVPMETPQLARSSMHSLQQMIMWTNINSTYQRQDIFQ